MSNLKRILFNVPICKNFCLNYNKNCPVVTRGINIVKPMFLFKTRDLWSNIMSTDIYPYMRHTLYINICFAHERFWELEHCVVLWSTVGDTCFGNGLVMGYAGYKCLKGLVETSKG